MKVEYELDEMRMKRDQINEWIKSFGRNDDAWRWNGILLGIYWVVNLTYGMLWYVLTDSKMTIQSIECSMFMLW